MLNGLKILKTQQGKISQNLLIVIAVLITASIALVVYFTGKNKTEVADEHGDEHAEGEEHAEGKEQGDQHVGKAEDRHVFSKRHYSAMLSKY